MNFLEETKRAIEVSAHTIEQVMFIGSADGKFRMDWATFCETANFEYDNGFGSQVIPKDLIIYFVDKSYCVRDEYDGSERWEYNQPLNFALEDEYEKIKIIPTRNGYATLADSLCPQCKKEKNENDWLCESCTEILNQQTNDKQST